MPLNTLQDIRTKVRRLTRTPSLSQMSDAELDNYINTFVVYDFPEHLRTFNLRKQFTFYTNPYQDTYATDEISFAGATTNVLYNFQNKYITVHPPVYIAGYLSLYSQSREQFFGIYPMLNNIAQTGVTGDGATTQFSGFVQSAGAGAGLLQRQVLFDSVDANAGGLSLVDVPVVDPITGYNTVFGNLYTPGTIPATPPTVVNPTNFINYATGQFTITFSAPPAANAPINSQTIPLILGLPQALLFYQNQFTVRPIPDQPYRINFEVYARPVELLSTNQAPELEEWWQYISYGAAKKVFEDRMDMDSVAMIMPEYKKQEALCLRRTIVQQTNERVATIYTEQTGFNGWNSWGWGNNSF